LTRSFRLTRKAEDSLVDIARWTIEQFGARQADLYETELVARCEALARGDAVSRSCAILVDDEMELPTRGQESILSYSWNALLRS
jgi:toxin ParE1/3/4